MAIYRGTGGSTSTTEQATIDAVNEDAATATTKAAEASASAAAAATSATNAANSATNATSSKNAAATSASNAASSATTAATSAINASTSATSASTSATTATTQATLAASLAANALDSKTDAETAETNAAASATAAASSATSASTSASTATTKASQAATSATNAATSATAAATSATAAASSATDAETARAAAESLLDQFDDQYLGAKATEPTVDNDGDPLQEGAVYWNSAENSLYFYTGSIWEAPEDLASASAAAAAASETAAAASETAAAASETAAAASETAAASSASAASSSASAASTSATNAAASETAASASETAAASSETAAAASETAAASSASSASTSASAAAASETAAAASETAAAASETAAAGSASTASTQATNAATSATSAASSASTATTKASEASTSATNAASSASSAATSASNAQTSADAALAALDNFDDRYLGQKSSDPTVDNDGDALIAGALYFNTTDDTMKVYEGSTWVAAYASLSGAVLQSNNLSDLADASASRTNLGVAIGTDVQAYSSVLSGTTASYTTAEETKLAGIEASADVTDTTNVVAALTAGTAISIAGDGTISYTGSTDVVGDTTPQLGGTLDANGNIIDMGVNTITDTKVGQWDTAYGWGNHASAGYTTGNQTITLSGDVSGSGTTAITVTVADDSHNHVISNVDGLQAALDGKVDDSQVLTNVPSGAVFTDTTYSVGNGGLTEINFTSALNSKLSGIESGATADQTASEILTAIKTVDGTGSGLDADYLDGIQGSQLLRSDASDTASQRIVFTACESNNWDTIATSSGSRGGLEVYNSGAGNDAFMTFHAGGDFACYFGLDADANDIAVGGWSMGAAKYKIWHQGNDGSGSGLDADTLDGQQGSYYYPASNPNGYTTNVGDITGVTAGSGISGGGTSGTVTISHADTSSQGSVNNSGNTMIQDITLDTYGHITGITSATVSASTFLTGQSWQNLTSSRGMNTWYTNSTGKPIIVQVDMDYGDLDLRSNGLGTGVTYVGGQHGINANDFMIVMPGEQYACLAAGGRYERYWFEYR